MQISKLLPRFFILIPLALSLVACGSSGSDSGSDSTSKPTISGTPEAYVRAGQTYSFTPSTFDADGDTLSYDVTNAPYWAMFDNSSGDLSGSPVSSDLGEYPNIIITVSDGQTTAELPPFTLVVLPQQLSRNNFSTQGEMIQTVDGYKSVGTLEIATGERTQVFEESDLDLTFDEQGHLIDISGETILPANPTDYITIDSPVRAVVSMMSGAEINADPDIDIQLLDNSNYFVFFIGSNVDITIESQSNPGVFESVNLETPLAGKILMITDPTDPFLYRFGSQPLIGENGSGSSSNGLIPFSPQLDSANLDSFNGHIIEKGSMDLGIKIFDFFKISGMRVTKMPQFGDINWNDPFNSSIEYKTGINGDVDFGFSVLSVGLFSFDLAEMSATLDVGFDRQSMAMQTRIGPDVSWVPSWFHFVPTTEAKGDWFVNGKGEYSIELEGSFASTIPKADVAGVMVIENGAVTLAGRTVNEGETLEVSLRFADNETVGRIKFPESFANSIKGDVTESMDRALVEVDQALGDLEAKISDYQFELSLRGLRSAIPGIVDGVIIKLNKIPAAVGKVARTGALKVMATECLDLGFIGVWCIDDVINATSYANTAKNSATKIAQNTINKIKPNLIELKTLAASADDDVFREALRKSLLYAYNNRTFSKTITVTRKISATVLGVTANFGTVTLYSKKHTRTVLDATTANKIKLAADNIYRIPLTSDLMINAQQVFDALPIDETIQKVRQEVIDGVAVVPNPEGLGYRAIGNTYEAFVTIDGVDHDIKINVLRPSDVQTGVSDLLKNILLGGAI